MDGEAFAILMDQGARQFESGHLSSALHSFQKARRANPQDCQALYACATVLSAQGDLQAGYQLLHTHQDLYPEDADGQANLAIAAEAVGQDAQAQNAYARALALDPHHVRALNNLALRAAQTGQWEDAIEKMAQCVALAPAEAILWTNLIDFLNGARRDADALARSEQAVARFPESTEVVIRRFACLAFAGQIEAAHQALAVLGPNARQILDTYLRDAASNLPKQFQKHAISTPDAFEFYCVRSFDAMNTCDWRRNAQLADWLMQKLAHVQQTGEIRDWRDTQFYALFLGLTEAQELALRKVTIGSIETLLKSQPHWRSRDSFLPYRPRDGDSRIHIGISTQYLGDEKYRLGLMAQLQLHDHNRFAIHLYSPMATSDQAALAALRQTGASVVEVGQLSDQQAVERIRQDKLDLWMDDAFYTPWCRPEVRQLRVAPVQMRRQSWSRVDPTLPSEYMFGDTFTHPDSEDLAPYQNLARFSYTCWMPCNGDVLGDRLGDASHTPSLSRLDAGLPDHAPVLLSNPFALAVDPQTFATWMAILRRAPNSVLWLAPYPPEVRANLAREAQQAGVDAKRLLHLPKLPRQELLTWLQLADLYLDTLRFNATHTLVDALKRGVPAITLRGHNMASRLGGSIITAAGMPDCVFESAQAYENAAVALCLNPQSIAALRSRLAALHPSAPLFDEPARVRDWEWAWQHMVQRDRAGLPPASFAVPMAT